MYEQNKKAIAAISAATMLFGSATTAMTASADATQATKEDLVALYQWTTVLESYGIPFSKMGVGRDDRDELVKLLKENELTATKMCSEMEDMSELAELFEEFGIEEGEINEFFAGYMLGKQYWVNSKCTNCIPGKNAEHDERARQLEADGYVYTENGWYFDVEEYLLSKKAENPDPEVVIPGDINVDGVFGIADVVTLQKALSTNSVTPDMDVNGDGKVNVFDLVAAKRMLADVIGRGVKSL